MLRISSASPIVPASAANSSNRNNINSAWRALPFAGSISVINKTKVASRCRLEMKALFGGMFFKPEKLPEAKDCLPGRQTEMPITNKHYVLGTPVKGPFPENLEVAVFGTGCFWGTEKGYWRIPGVHSTAVVYASGHTPNPQYSEVCSGMTGHNEAVQVVWDPAKVSYADLLTLFWTSHDPTQGMRQGNDVGTQYRSGIYVINDRQKALAEASMAAYQEAISAKGYGKITTEIVENPPYFFAEDYHQQYLAKPGARPYCSAQPTGVPMPPYEKWAVPGLEDLAPKVPTSYWKEHGPRPGCTIGFPNEQVVLSG
uniref:peptide-methionine (S)-S-oxide reductase n=1 Tax=Tetraselmis sp. GSL018 TaxID=582737 RepID=A0A061RJ99_9CHLO|mmetsp:Transcript_13457/g.31870  ORF Transcript_13457/g.31870 Transcript_13457/m.31870 type:complete len:313 (+) Transcript_13457:261-1199(+)